MPTTASRLSAVEAEVGLDCSAPLDEERHRAEAQAQVAADLLRLVRERQRRNRHGVFAGYVQRLPAGCQDPQPRRLLQQRLGERRALLQEVFAVVQDQQHLPVAQVVGEDGQRVAPGRLVDLQRLRHCLREQTGVGEVGEVDQPHLVGERPMQAGRHP